VSHPNPTSSPYTLSSPGVRPATAGPTHTHTHSRTLHGRSVHDDITNSMSHPNPNEFTLHVMFHRCPAGQRRTLYIHTQTLTNWKSVHDDNSLSHRTPDKLTLHVIFHRCAASRSRALSHTHTHTHTRTEHGESVCHDITHSMSHPNLTNSPYIILGVRPATAGPSHDLNKGKNSEMSARCEICCINWL